MTNVVRLRDFNCHAAALVAALLMLAAASIGRPAMGQSAPQTVRLVVDYGDGVTKTISDLSWTKGNTVLDAMKAAAARPHGISFSYTGVGDTAVMTKIDEVQNQGVGAGKKNWQYWVNEAYGDRSFAAFELQAQDVVVWRFTTEQGKMMPMNSLTRATSMLRSVIRAPRALPMDFFIIAGLIGLDVAARLAPHAPNFTPVAASALFAAGILRVRVLALLVPIAGMLLGDAVHGFYDWRMMAVVYGALALPAGAACLSRALRGPRMVVPVMVASSLAFFAITNFAVWGFGAMYAASAGGLITCYVAALPFLKYTIAGDLFWAVALFGGYWLMQNIPAANRNVLEAVVIGAE